MVDPARALAFGKRSNDRHALRRNDTASADIALQQASAENPNAQLQRRQRG
jgi:hypothetical protein